MITKLNSSAPAGEKKGGIGGWILGGLAVLGLAWAGYEFWWKPKKEAEEAEKAKADARAKEEAELNKD